MVVDLCYETACSPPGGRIMARCIRILIVDDEPDVLDLLGTFLAESGLEPVTCSSAEEALQILQTHPFDLILTDVRMAEMSGFELLKIVRAQYPAMAIIIMTAYESEFPMSKALGAGADGYLSKPFSLKSLSLLFEEAYWKAISRQDWWDKHLAAAEE